MWWAESVAELIPYILEIFLESDRSFAEARKCELSAKAERADHDVMSMRKKGPDNRGNPRVLVAER
jgi:Protein of unknown function (DUF2274)